MIDGNKFWTSCPTTFRSLRVRSTLRAISVIEGYLRKLTFVQGTTTESPATSVTPSLNKLSQGRKITRSSIRTLRCELSSPPSLPPSRLESPKSNRQNATRRLRGTAQRTVVLDLMGVSLAHRSLVYNHMLKTFQIPSGAMVAVDRP